MEASRAIAVVTGGNRGIGREVCRQLAAAGTRVLLAARREDQAAEAARALGAGVEPVVLDVTDAGTVTRLVELVRARYGAVDALVNNAGVALDGFNADVARRTLAVNVHGVMAVTDAFLAAELLTRGAAIVMVSSGMGELDCIRDKGLRARLLDPALTREGLRALLDEFLAAVEDGTHARRGWPSSGYRVSKVALNAYTRILARELGDDAQVNAVCPGWVRTDMGGASASRSVEEGARGVVWAASRRGVGTGPTGQFLRDGEAIYW
ncbi:MAG: SDR family NAD(P)-dependent oxidoreductase [Myxococcales bacterium]|nr:SDR family NAD(P)-dependent oxidoreductase [Myxococcales bacterium]